jgi:hypothetical protein
MSASFCHGNGSHWKSKRVRFTHVVLFSAILPEWTRGHQHLVRATWQANGARSDP